MVAEMVVAENVILGKHKKAKNEHGWSASEVLQNFDIYPSPLPTKICPLNPRQKNPSNNKPSWNKAMGLYKMYIH